MSTDIPKAKVVEFAGEPRNRFLRLRQLREMPMPQPVIDGVLFTNQLHVVFGPQGGSKTAVMLDMALHGIQGRPWMGRETRCRRVAYVCGEGGGKILGNRIDAWLTHHGVNDEKIDDALLVTEYPVYMLDDESVDDLMNMIDRESDVDLVIVDTLSANFGDGDENFVADMGRFINAIQRIRIATTAGVVIVHHTGHHDKTRPQGSNKLRRDVDIELLVNVDAQDDRLFGLVGGNGLKSRNGPACGMIPYRLHEVTIDGTDYFGNPLTSIVCVPSDDNPQFELTGTQKQRRGRNQVAALRALAARAAGRGHEPEDKVIVAEPEWREIYKSAGLDRKQASRVKDSLIKDGVFSFSVGGFSWEMVNV